MLRILLALTGLCGLAGNRLASAWGVLLPGMAIAGIAALDPDFSQWRVVMVIALLLTLAMLFHQRLRHYLLLPSCMALLSGLVAVSMNFRLI